MTLRDLTTFSRLGGSTLQEVIALACKISEEIIASLESGKGKISNEKKLQLVATMHELLEQHDLPIGEKNLFNKIDSALQTPPGVKK